MVGARILEYNSYLPLRYIPLSNKVDTVVVRGLSLPIISVGMCACLTLHTDAYTNIHSFLSWKESTRYTGLSFSHWSPPYNF